MKKLIQFLHNHNIDLEILKQVIFATPLSSLSKSLPNWPHKKWHRTNWSKKGIDKVNILIYIKKFLFNEFFKICDPQQPQLLSWDYSSRTTFNKRNERKFDQRDTIIPRKVAKMQTSISKKPCIISGKQINSKVNVKFLKVEKFNSILFWLTQATKTPWIICRLDSISHNTNMHWHYFTPSFQQRNRRGESAPFHSI